VNLNVFIFLIIKKYPQGFFQLIAIMEIMIEHVASYLKLDPYDVRVANLYKKNDVTPIGQPLPYFNADIIMQQLRQTSEYDKRRDEIRAFNSQNRWKKRGISMTPIKWGLPLDGANYNCMISIYAADGSVSLTHGGVEIGQGIHTVVSQVCAYSLKIPIETISVKHTNIFTAPNGPVSFFYV
jgi:xanthine dehydrogenase molybdopterin-binding subunit B